MSDELSGPQRSSHAVHRADKPYERPVTRRPPSQLRRATSIVDSLRSIVTRPLSWLSGAPAEVQETPSTPKAASAVQNSSKRRASSPYDEPTPTPKKRRRASPFSSNWPENHSDVPKGVLRASVSVPHLSSTSAAMRPGRTAFLPPLPRMTPSRQGSMDPTRIGTPTQRENGTRNSVYIAPSGRSGSMTPQPLLGGETTAFGLRYRSPFMSRPSPAPNYGAPMQSGISRQSSVASDRTTSFLPKPRNKLAADELYDDELSPTRPAFSPAVSPTRRLSDGVSKNLVPPMQSTSLSRRSSSIISPNASQLTFPRSSVTTNIFQRLPSLGPLNTTDALAQADRAVAHIASPQKAARSLSAVSVEHGTVTPDRIFQALEEAMPWSEARKLRVEQRSKIKVPKPGPASAGLPARIGGRAGRMVKPYARLDTMGLDNVEPIAEKKDIVASLEEKRKQSQQTREKSLLDEPVLDESKDEEKPQPVVAEKATMSDTKSLLQSTLASSTAEFIPPSNHNSDQFEPREALPFALLPATPSSTPKPAIAITAAPSGRIGRAKTAVHTSSATLSGRDKRPNRFGVDAGDDDRDDAMDEEDDGMPGAGELKQWASKTGISLEIPTGWSFGGAKIKTPASIIAKSEGVTVNSFTAPPMTSLPLSKPSPFPKALPSALKTNTSDVQDSNPFKIPSSGNPFAAIGKGNSTKPSPFAGPSPFGSPTAPGSVDSVSSFAPYNSAPAGGQPSLFAGFGGIPSTAKSHDSNGSGKEAINGSKEAPAPPSNNGSTTQPGTVSNEDGGTQKPDSDGTVTSKPSLFSSFSGTGSVEPPPSPFAIPPGKPSVFGNKNASSVPVEPSNGEVVKPSPFAGFGLSKPDSSSGGSSHLTSFGVSRLDATSAAGEKPSHAVVESKSKPFATFSAHTLDAAAAAAATKSTFGGFGASDAEVPTKFTLSPSTGFESPSQSEKTSPFAAFKVTQSSVKPETVPTSSVDSAVQSGAAAATTTNGVGGASAETPKLSPLAGFGAAPPLNNGSAPQPKPSFGGFGALGAQSAPPTPSPFTGFNKPAVDSGAAAAQSSDMSAPINQPVIATPSSFAFGSTTSPAMVPYKFGQENSSKAPTTPSAPSSFSFGQAGTPSNASNTAFSFGASNSSSSAPVGTLSSNSFSFGASAQPAFGAKPERPKTPPNFSNGDSTMDTSPLQNHASANGSTLGTQPSGFSVPTFAFGPMSNANAPISFGAPQTASPFAFGGGSQPGTPISPLNTLPVSNGFGAAAAPASPFGQTQSLPVPSFGFGSAPVASHGSQPPAFGFNFSPVASPTLSPTLPSSNVPFVFGVGSDSGAHTPGTPTTPNRRPLKTLPRRGGKR